MDLSGVSPEAAAARPRRMMATGTGGGCARLLKARRSAVERATDFELTDDRGRPWRLGERLAEGPVLLVFYRGDW
jgi:hypothetical protein